MAGGSATMTQGIEFLEIIYGQLKAAGIIRSKGEFSERLLGKSPSYLTSMRAKQRIIASKVIEDLSHSLLAEIEGYGPDVANVEVCALLRRAVAQVNVYLADQTCSAELRSTTYGPVNAYQNHLVPWARTFMKYLSIGSR
jgi:hypothetical protein